MVKRSYKEIRDSERELHNRIYRNYDEIRENIDFSRRYHDVWMEEMISFIKKQPKRILDFCCGTSVAFPVISKKFADAEYYGNDISDKMIEVGRSRYGKSDKFHTYRQDGSDLKFKPGFFDAVIARGAIHHLPDQEMGLRNIYRVLKNNGIFVVSEPASNPAIKGLRKIFYKIIPHYTPTHVSYTTKELEHMLLKVGFEIIDRKKLGLIAYPFAFPDHIPIAKHIPSKPLEKLAWVDEKLVKLPLVNRLAWSIIIAARKKR